MSALISKLPIPATLVERLQPVLALLPSSVPKPLKWAFFALLISASRLSAFTSPAVGYLGELRGEGAQEGGGGGGSGVGALMRIGAWSSPSGG